MDLVDEWPGLGLAVAAESVEIDGNTSNPQIEFARDAVSQSPGFAEGHVHDSPTGLAIEMVVGLRVPVIAHRPGRRGNGLHVPLVREHFEVSVHGSQGKLGEIIRQAGMDLGRRGVTGRGTEPCQDAVALAGPMPAGRSFGGRGVGGHAP